LAATLSDRHLAGLNDRLYIVSPFFASGLVSLALSSWCVTCSCLQVETGRDPP
jgi:hypothetical protein